MKSTRENGGVASAAPVGLSSQNPIVDEIGQMQFEGSILDKRWFQCAELKFKSGQLNLPALVVLADILWWHRPTIIVDEATNQIEAVKTKFSQRELWKSYPVWAASLGLTDRQARAAVKFLSDRKIIRRRTGTFKLSGGARSNNVVFLTPIPNAIRRITYGTETTAENEAPATRQPKAPRVQTGGAARQNVRPSTAEREISTSSTPAENTETTTTADADFSNLIEELIAAGVTPSTAKKNATKYAGEMRRRLAMLPHIEITTTPAAFLSARPHETWTEPRQITEAEAATARDVAARRAAEERAATAKSAGELRATNETKNAELNKLYEALPKRERKKIEATARAQVAPMIELGIAAPGALGAAIRNQMRDRLKQK